MVMGPVFASLNFPPYIYYVDSLPASVVFIGLYFHTLQDNKAKSSDLHLISVFSHRSQYKKKFSINNVQFLAHLRNFLDSNHKSFWGWGLQLRGKLLHTSVPSEMGSLFCSSVPWKKFAHGLVKSHFAHDSIGLRVSVHSSNIDPDLIASVTDPGRK